MKLGENTTNRQGQGKGCEDSQHRNSHPTYRFIALPWLQVRTLLRRDITLITHLITFLLQVRTLLRRDISNITLFADSKVCGCCCLQ